MPTACFEQRLRFVEPPLHLDGIGQVVERHRVFGVRLAEHAAVDRQRLAKQRFRAGGIALGDQQLREAGLGGADVRMVGAQHAFAGRHVLAKERLGAGQIAALPQQLRQLVLARRGFAMLVAEDLLANRQRLADRRFGFRVRVRGPSARAPVRRA